MAQQNEELKELQIRKLLLDSFSSNLNNHGRLFIGVSVLLLALFEIRLRTLELSTQISGLCPNAVYLGILVVAFAFWFLLMRTLVYGALINAAYHARLSKESGTIYMKSWRGIGEHVKDKKFLGYFSIRLFCTIHIEKVTEELEKVIEKQILCWRIQGAFVCVFFALVTTILAWIVLG